MTDKGIPQTFRLRAKDRENIAIVREKFPFMNKADAIRYALQIAAQETKRRRRGG